MTYQIYDQIQWQGILSYASLAVLLLLANLMRRKIRFIRNALIPTSVLAGFLGLLLRSLGLIQYDIALFERLTYHSLAIGFIALSLRTPPIHVIKNRKQSENVYNGVNSGMLIVSNYLMQGVIGLAISILASISFSKGIFPAAGILLPMGYGQGPGQANNIGSMYQSFGFQGGSSFGLAIASAGFLWASVGGIFYLIYAKRKGLLHLNRSEKDTAKDIRFYEEENAFPLSEPVDRLSLQLALIGLVYLLCFAFIYLVLRLVTFLPNSEGILSTLAPLLWGFNFIIASSIALLTRGVFQKLQEKKIMTHQYPNTYLLNRISGVAFDIMIIAGISSIRLEDIQGKWLVFLLLSTFGGVLTLLYNHFMAKAVYPDYPLEGMLGMYGMMTGTASAGIMLLQQADPNFETPMSHNLIFGSSTAIVFSIPILVVVGIAPKSLGHAIFSLFAILIYFIILHFSLLHRCKKHKLKLEKE